MRNDKFLERKLPRFYKEPSDDDIEANGWAMANIHARMRARIVSSRLLATTVALGTGTAITAQELLTNNGAKPVNVIANFCIPAIINGLAEIKVERQLRHTEHEVAELLPDILNANNSVDNTPYPLSDT